MKSTDYVVFFSSQQLYYAQMLKRIQLDKPAKWLAIQNSKEKPLSDKKTEMTWNATEEGEMN